MTERRSENAGPFSDGQLGVFCSRLVIDDGMPILLVFHHDEDGDWQFSTSEEKSHDQIAHVHLGHVLEAEGVAGFPG